MTWRPGGGFAGALVVVASVVLGGLSEAASAAGAASEPGVDPFYAQTEQQGLVALERGRPADAARLLRTACFGLLELPERLAVCVVRLAQAQSRADDGAGFARSFERLEQLEERFGVVRPLPLAAGDREELAAAIRERIDPGLLAGSPVGFLAATERLAVTDEKGAPDTRTQLEPAPERTVSLAEPATLEAPSPDAVPSTAAPDRPSAASVARARELLSGSPTEAELASALLELEPFAARRPADRELQQLVAMLAYRASRWPLCAEHFRRSGDADEARPLVRFYMAVCFYETGDRAGAVAALQPALDRLKRTPFVDAYLAKILGASSGAP